MQYVAVTPDFESITLTDFSNIGNKANGSVLVITTEPKAIHHAPAYSNSELEVPISNQTLVSIQELEDLPNVEKVVSLKLTVEQHKQAKEWYVKGFGLSNIAEHFGLNSDEMRHELNNHY
ncbi:MULTISPECIES: hypothetical protein [Vibrio]|nr:MULTISPECIES: hypothetical protein [Vibrio]EGR2854531.1 hypothetical protein [Vibrio parahaemolyticus]EGR2988777.1 hypothetical protein [Vibrio parahaemolyticus]MBE4203034.1 hypothetical protein [Vibrio parahaemolyticus]MCX8796022.1 hypothetical protein [Vibrio parahaemolyticus]MEA5356083.1 hypothetical protein [Vibrio parahaemolyticus]